ncbi:MAG: hypothetical protein FWF66_03010 [Candidatus Bathyarchaeota archaeon]|nr:hypothetical protein [Candidatus Termiticorpusculum sp.]
MTKIVTVKCPFCGSENVDKSGHNATGKQVYLCRNSKCKHFSFVDKYTYKAYNPQVREQVLKMAIDCTELMPPSAFSELHKIRLPPF